MSVNFPGFPTLNHLEHTARLEKSKVRVFEMCSQGFNTILTLAQKEFDEVSLLAEEYLDRTVYVSWPHLIEALVVKICDGKTMSYKEEGVIKAKEMDELDTHDYNNRIRTFKELYKNRKGIVIGETPAVLYVKTLSGRRYVEGSQGRMTLQKQWTNYESIAPIQTVVKDIAAFDTSYVQHKSLEDIFPIGSKCFILSKLHYGEMAEIAKVSNVSGNVQAKFAPSLEPDLTEVVERQEELISENYVSNYNMAQRLSISNHLLSRITGTIFVKKSEFENYKVNIGLNLKFKSRGEEVPGYSKRRNDQWLFTQKVHDITVEYIEKFPEIFRKLSVMGDKDSYDYTDFFPSETG